MKSLIRSNPILSYLIITFLITWSFWSAPMILSLPKDINLGIILIGGFGPAISAFILLHIQSETKIKIELKYLFWIFTTIAILVISLATFFVIFGNSDSWNRNFWNGLNELSVLSVILLLANCFFWGLMMSNSKKINLRENYLKSFLFDSSKLKWYAFAFLFYPILYALSYAFGKFIDLETTEYFFNPDPYFFLAIILTFFFTGGPEEFGWRGFFQKELQKKYNPLTTTILIALVWTLWHIPLHYNGFYPSDFNFSERFLLSFQLSLLFTWLYNKSGYSILTVMILHSMINNVSEIFGSSYYPAMTIGVVIILIFVIDNKMWQKKNYHTKFYSTECLQNPAHN